MYTHQQNGTKKTILNRTNIILGLLRLKVYITYERGLLIW